ncbi:MAG: four helix bundle protein [Chloroflexota bacterium]
MLKRLSNHVQPRISRISTNFAHQTSNLRALCVLCGELRNSLLGRKYPRNFVSKLTDSDTEATETIVWLDFALHFKYLTPSLHKELEDHYDHT